MNFDKNYYEVLGVEKSASASDIKKAYRKLAAKWHPDKFVGKDEAEQREAESKMKDINEAYDILSDENKRREYDAGPQMGFNPWGGFNPFGGGFQREYVPTGRNVGIKLTVTWDDILKGGINRNIKYHKNVRCPKCHGSGGEDVQICTACNGSGQRVHIERRGNMMMQQVETCPVCGGRGKIVKTECSECHGQKFQNIEVEEHIELLLPYIVMEDIQLTNPGLGSESEDERGPNGDLIIKIKHELPEGIEIINGRTFDVVNHLEVPYYDLLLGTKVNIETPQGKTVSVTIPKCTKPGKELRLKGQGIKFYHPEIGQEIIGDYYVIPQMQYKSELSNEEEKYLNKIKANFLNKEEV